MQEKKYVGIHISAIACWVLEIYVVLKIISLTLKDMGFLVSRIPWLIGLENSTVYAM